MKLEDGKLKVISDLIHLRAAKEAKLEQIGFDLILDRQIPLEQLLEQYDLQLDLEEAKKGDFIRNYLFFINLPLTRHDNYPRIRLHPENDTFEFRDAHCIGYDLLMTGTYKDRVLNERYFIKAMVAHNGLLRSWNGVKRDSKTLRGYFDRS